jgi:putative aldouronate transport system substrate-binding protein
MALIQTPLMDYVNEMTLKFVVGKSNLSSDWDSYVSECESKGSTDYIEEANEIFEATKSLLGY